MLTNAEISNALANIEYQRKRAGTGYLRGIKDFGKRTQFLLPKAAAGYGQRGIIDSGITRRGLTDIATGIQTGYSDLRSGYDDVIIDLLGQELGHEQNWADARVMNQIDKWASDVQGIASRADWASKYREATQ